MKHMSGFYRTSRAMCKVDNKLKAQHTCPMAKCSAVYGTAGSLLYLASTVDLLITHRLSYCMPARPYLSNFPALESSICYRFVSLLFFDLFHVSPPMEPGPPGG